MSILTVPQPIYPLSYHLHAIFQFRQIAVPTLMISTYVGSILAICVVQWINPAIDQLAKKYVSRRSQHTDLFKYSAKGSTVLAGVLTLAGVNIGVSKLFKLPFSRLSSFGITVLAIAIPVLTIAGVNYAAVRFQQNRRRLENAGRLGHDNMFTPISSTRRNEYSMFGEISRDPYSFNPRGRGHLRDWSEGDFERTF